ncbi:Hypothetical predicted protein [Olea europaea subsp. europaea]|uniref:Uncharacterized protein n=1 Tax=Olea europaea subsp. europaea TaxID=158383 RepID=A0A8S0RID2_OLEEU|nr:Hypothetical predicted protein [Olea europaea subsp. europaea]
MKNQALIIAPPFSFAIALTASIFAVILAIKDHIWTYATLEFALVALTLHLFYSMLHIPPVYAILLSSVLGFGVAMSINSLYNRYISWRVQVAENSSGWYNCILGHELVAESSKGWSRTLNRFTYCFNGKNLYRIRIFFLQILTDLKLIEFFLQRRPEDELDLNNFLDLTATVTTNHFVDNSRSSKLNLYFQFQKRENNRDDNSGNDNVVCTNSQ